MLSDLSGFIEVDREKQRLISEGLNYDMEIVLRNNMLSYDDECLYNMGEIETKFCPKCHKKYFEGDNVCYDCLIALKPLSDKINVYDIKSSPEFTFEGKNTFDDFGDVFTDENADKINDFRFAKSDFDEIIINIKKTSLLNLDEMIRTNYVDLNELSPLESVLLFTKTFVSVNYKSYGRELGYFESETVTVDDRQSTSLQITTLIHELSHFLLKQIIVGVLSKILDSKNTVVINALATYILSYSSFTCLIDEYAAHCCEGRFTVYGYQDYSSFLSIVSEMDGEMSADEIEITKAIGNTFANSIKDILEIFIDRELFTRIKEDFKANIFDRPNYEMLKLENCNKLTDEGFLKAMHLIISEGFKTAADNVTTLEEMIK